jgi:hypothetical protein
MTEAAALMAHVAARVGLQVVSWWQSGKVLHDTS